MLNFEQTVENLIAKKKCFSKSGRIRRGFTDYILSSKIRFIQEGCNQGFSLNTIYYLLLQIEPTCAPIRKTNFVTWCVKQEKKGLLKIHVKP